MFSRTELFGDSPSALTVVGMAKNAGKTVTMNSLQQSLQEAGHALGLLSIGVDGERFDALTRLPKPAVVVQPGTLVATAEHVLAADGRWEYLRPTPIFTPMGRIVILRALAKNRVVLAGPSKKSDVKNVSNQLIELGAECVLIDGAFDRQSPADPLVSDRVVLASGATLSRDLDRLVAMTKCRVEQLSLPACNAEYARLAAGSTTKVRLLVSGWVREVNVLTALLSEEEWRRILRSECDAVFLKGAVGEGLGGALLSLSRPPVVVIEDGGKIFMNAGLWERLRQRGICFQAVRPISLLAVTVNPTLPGGVGVDADELLTAMGKALAPLPVIDVVREKRLH